MNNSSKRRRAPEAENFVVGGGEMGALIRAKDWSSTPLGPLERWPQSLRSAVSILLPSKAQIAMFWGEELITLYNDAYRPVLGAKHPGALGKPIWEVWDELWWKGLREMFEVVLRTGEALWARDRPFFMERHGYVEETYFDISYDPIRDESGRVGGVFCIVNETTRRVLADRRLRALRDLGDLSLHIRSVEEVYPAAADILSRYPEDAPFVLFYAWKEGDGAKLMACTGLPYGSPAAPAVLPAPYGASWRPSDDVVVLEGEALARFGELHAGPWPEPIRQVVVAPCSLSGSERRGWLVIGVSPRRRLDEDYLDFLRMTAANVASSVASAQRLEDERKRVQMLAELDRAKTAFFSNVSHEFRTPLTMMLGPLHDLLARSGGETLEQHRALLETIERNARRLLKLVNTLLDFARIEANRAQASYEPVDLPALTTELASSFRSACERAGVALRIECAPASESAFVDREMWEKIVLNLVSNAFKYTFEGEIAVRLEETERAFELIVSDTGVGIPGDALPHIFERFYRVQGAGGRSHEGSGIGLALVHELVKLHGGTLTAKSAPGKGATFAVSIPKGDKHLPAEHVRTASARRMDSMRAGAYADEALSWLSDDGARPESTPSRDAPRVLLAEDNADLREYVRRLLSEHYRVEAVGDGLAALKAARAQRPDVIVSDVMMPGLDGFDLIRAIRADRELENVPVLLLSARAGEEARMEGLGHGADDYVVKPFSARELLVRVGSLLHTAELRARSLEQQRRAAEQAREQFEELEALMEALPVGVFIARDPKCAHISANAAGAAMLRLPPGANASKSGAHQAFRVLKNGVEVAPQDLPMQRAARHGVSIAGEELEIAFDDGTSVTFYEYATPLFDSAGAVRGCLGVFIDLTERKQMERALRRSEERLKEADRRKDEFLAMLAHELRNPLAPIANALQLLRREDLVDRVRQQALAIIDRQTARLARLVDDLLEVSRITTGRIQLHMEVVAIAGVVERAAETVRPLIEQHRHTLTVSLPEETLFVYGDATRLEQVFVNLLNNAAKYTEDGGRIEMAAGRSGDAVVVSVRDTGVGIDPELLPHVFELFTQAERSLDRAGGGLGIGLSLVQRLVAMHGGTVGAISELGRGSEFTVRLPATEREIGVPSAKPGPLSCERGLRVLVVDDNVDAAMSLALLLEAAGHSVETAHDGRAALELARQHRPDIVFLDVGLPLLDGYSVARRLRADESLASITLVALTGYGQHADRQRAEEAGFDRHVTKPASFDVLEEILAQAARRS